MNETKTLVMYFADQYEKRFRRRYPVTWARHMSVAKQLLELYSLADLKQYVTIYLFDLGDPFYRKAGMRFELLRSALPQVMELAAQQSAAGSADTGSARREYERVETARREAASGTQARKPVGDV